MRIVMKPLTAAVVLSVSVVTAAEPAKKKAWSVDEETRKMVKFETGKDLVVDEDSGDRGPADRVYYGPGTREKMLAHMKETGRRTTWIENGVLYMDGRPSLRCGLYAPGYCVSRPHLRRLKETDDPGCDWAWEPVGVEIGNLVRGSEQREGRKAQKPSREVLDAVARRIAANRDKDFGYYYLCDEPECRGQSPVYLRYLYQFVKEQDPYHVVLICSRAAERYVTCCDWIEVHPYLAPRYDSFGRREFGTEPGTFGNYVEGVVAMNRPDKVIGCTPTAFGYLGNSYDQDTPTFDEYVASVWAILLEGGRSIFPFLGRGLATSHDLYEGVRYTFSSAKALQDYLLFGTRTRLEKNDDWAATLWERGGEKLLAVVNFRPVGRKVALPGVTGNFREFRGGRTWNAGAVFELKPYETIVATTSPCDAGLAALADVKANLAGLNEARLHRDNQILGRSRELAFAASKPLTLQQGVCNGMLQDQAELFRGGNPWYEISFPSGALEFDRVLLHGDKLDRTTVKVRQKGEWVELADAKKTVEPYLVTLTLPKRCRTVKIRFEFHRDCAELYEIEFPYVKGGSPLPHPKTGLKYLAPDNLPTPNPDFHFAVTTNPPAPAAAVAPVSRVLPNQQCLVFDASNAEVCTNGWSGDKWYGLKGGAEIDAEGVFSLGTGGATHALKFDPKWRWIDFEIPREAVKTTERGYSNWGMNLLNHPAKQGHLCGNVRSCQTGHYVIPLRPIAKAAHGYIQISAINISVPLRYVRFSEMPPTRFEVTASTTNGVVLAGDRIEFRLTLEKPCEDVSLSFNVDHAGPRPYAINGSSSFELKCLDDTGRVWGGTIDVTRLDETSGGVYAKAVCLGGEQILPILTVIPARLEKSSGASAGTVCTRPDKCRQSKDAPIAAPTSKWKLVWEDEFNGDELDGSKWNYELGVIRNNEPQAYTAAKKNVRVENGLLVLEAHREEVANPKYEAGSTDFRKREKSRFSSGSVETLGKFAFTNAKVEVRARMSPVKGLFPAIWTMGTNIRTVSWPTCGETDVFEATGNDPTPSSTMHWYAPDGRKLPNGKAYKSLGHRVAGANASDGFHVYSAEWTDTSVVFSFDGVPHFEYPIETATVDGYNPYRLEQFLKLNLAIAPWKGTEIDEASFPGRFEIDWVRVYSKTGK